VFSLIGVRQVFQLPKANRLSAYPPKAEEMLASGLLLQGWLVQLAVRTSTLNLTTGQFMGTVQRSKIAKKTRKCRL